MVYWVWHCNTLCWYHQPSWTNKPRDKNKFHLGPVFKFHNVFLVHCWNVRFARTASLHWNSSLCCIKRSGSTQQEKQYTTMNYTGLRLTCKSTSFGMSMNQNPHSTVLFTRMRFVCSQNCCVILSDVSRNFGTRELI